MANKLSDRMKSMLSSRTGKIVFFTACFFVVVAIAVGGNLWYQHYKYVSSGNANISAPLISVGSLAPCQVISLEADYGSYVEKGQRIAVVGTPRSDNPGGMQG